ncbi:MAG: histidinol-phosphate transaminase [Dehalococcoidia bacterium]
MPRFDPVDGLRPALRTMPEYQALEDLDDVARRFGVDPADVIKIDGNENPFGASPRALEVLRNLEYRPEWYGDDNQTALRGALGGRLGVPPECVVAGSGSDELIDQIFRMYLGPGDTIVVASPTFGMYAFDAALHGARVVDVPLLDDWSFDADGLVAAAREAKAVFIPSPNNPTGGLLPEALADRLLETGALLVVDEAYIEFASADSLARRAAAEDGLIVLRTLSKWGGLAGLRIGYGVMSPAMADLFRRAKQPYNVNAAAEAAAIASIEDAAILDERAAVVAAERDRVTRELARLEWIEPVPSQASFVLMKLSRGDGKTLRDALRRRGIFTRYFESTRLRAYLRISMGTPEQNDRVLAAIAEFGEELARG